jgi:chromosome segregation ATPase
VVNDNRDIIIDEVNNQINQTKSQQAKKQKQLADIEDKIKAVQRKVIATYTDKLNGVISEFDYLCFKESFDDEKEKLISRRERLEKDMQDYERSLQTQGSIDLLVDKYKEINELTHEVINDFIKTIQIGEKNPVTNEQEIIINWLF